MHREYTTGGGEHQYRRSYSRLIDLYIHTYVCINVSHITWRKNTHVISTFVPLLQASQKNTRQEDGKEYKIPSRAYKAHHCLVPKYLQVIFF